MAQFSRRKVLLGGAVVLVGGGFLARNLLTETYESAWYQTEDGVAIDGSDPVAYFTEQRPVSGSSEFALDWAGTTWHFASAENRDAFQAEPKKYAPQYGGYCAWAVGARKSLAPTEPAQWAVVDGKLYLNFNANVQERWKTDVPGFIQKGNQNWPELEASLL